MVGEGDADAVEASEVDGVLVDVVAAVSCPCDPPHAATVSATVAPIAATPAVRIIWAAERTLELMC
jgi:hypothetical protein